MNTIAATIVERLGGLSLLRLLLGTHKVVFDAKGIHFDIQGCAKINRAQIAYRESVDLYWITFFHYRPSKMVLDLIADYEKVYADQLRGMIESETGLFLRPMRIQKV